MSLPRLRSCTLSLATLLLLSACSDTVKPTEQPSPTPSAAQLPGQPTAKAITAVPDSTFRPRSRDYTTGHPDLPGMRVSFNTALVGLRPGATVGAVNALLQTLGATIVGGIGGTDAGPGALLALRLPTTTHGAMLAALETMRAAPEVMVADADVVMATQAVTAVGTESVEWKWTSAAYAGHPKLGTWGLAAIRAPQMWNLNPHLKAEGRTTATGVLDAGFDPAHEDLRNVITVVGRQRADDHGNHVASIIGAQHGNGVGIDGTTPFARLFLSAIPTSEGDTIASVGSGTWGLVELLRAQPEIRVVNVSLGFGWAGAALPSVNVKSREVANRAGTFWGLAIDVLAATQSLPVIVSAAGNDDGELAIYCAPLNNLGLRTIDSHAAIIVVEADSAADRGTGVTYARANLSNIGAHLSAPGVNVPGAVFGPSSYENGDGTSLSAPFVTGVISHLLALEPSLPSPTKARNTIRDLLLRSVNRGPSRGGQFQVDGFAASLELDVETGTDRVLMRLLDIDDGTIDGNTRIDPFNGAAVLTNEVRADTTVDMSDFRRWRDLMSAVVFEASAAFDGAADHPKRDVNGDGRFEIVAKENMFPFADFNGDGQLSLSAVAPMAGVLRPRGPMTDLAVLQTRFRDPDYSAADLDLLTASGDFQVSPEACSVSAGQSVRVRVTQSGGGFTREHRFQAGEARYVLTVPVVVPTGSAYVVQVARLDASGAVVSARDTTVRLALAQDVAVRSGCEDAALPSIQGHFRGTRAELDGTSPTKVCVAVVKIIGPTANPATSLGDGDFLVAEGNFNPVLFLPRFEIAGGRLSNPPGGYTAFRLRGADFSAPDAVYNHTVRDRDSTIISIEEIFSTSGSFDGTRLSLTILHSVFRSSAKQPRTLDFDEDRRFDLVRTANCP